MQLAIFEYRDDGSNNNVRTIEIDGEIWFVAADIAKVLEYKEPHKAITTHCKYGMKYPVSDNQGVMHETWIIPESDVYRLIIKSQMPRAEKFENWIFSEVLPSIRRTGRYGVMPVFVRRFNNNWNRVSPGYFSIISELFIRLHGKLEQAGHIIADKAPDGKELRPDVSVGKTFPPWLEKNYPALKDKFRYYKHIFEDGLEVAWPTRFTGWR